MIKTRGQAEDTITIDLPKGVDMDIRAIDTYRGSNSSAFRQRWDITFKRTNLDGIEAAIEDIQETKRLIIEALCD